MRTTKLQKNSGQAALIIILVTAVVVTIIVASVGRTVTDVRIATQSEESYQALNAAEAGIERGLLEIGINRADTVSDCSDFNDALTDANCRLDHFNPDTGLLTPSQSVFWYTIDQNYPSNTANFYDSGAVDEGDAATIWLTFNPYAEIQADMFSSVYNGTFTIRVDTVGASVSLQRTVLYEDAANTLLIDRTLSPCDAPGCVIPFDTNDIPYSNRAAMIRLSTIGGDITAVHVFGINPLPFPPQGRIIESHGHYLGSGEGDQAISKALRIIRWHDEVPPYFDFVLYSGGDVVK
ncbi:hypothetical protein HY469_03690 [Candidatus Roizmanbacteria bacterium]|nr:hypothetical protein [Candidatus Roizmanbacteria bacterium]